MQRKKIFCSHDNSLPSGFFPPGKPLDPVHLRSMFQKGKPEKLFKEWFIIYLYFSPTSEPLEGVSCVRCVLNLSGHSSCVPHIYLFSMSFTLFNIYPAVLCHRTVFKISYMHFIKSHIDKQELFGVASVRSLERTLFSLYTCWF